MITRKQAKLLRKFANITACTKRVRPNSDDKKTLDDINLNHPGSVHFYYGGEPVVYGYDNGYCLFELKKGAYNLLAAWEEAAVFGYEVRGTDSHGRQISEHFVAESESRLRAQLKRKHGPVEITHLEPMTKAVWERAYGWGRM